MTKDDVDFDVWFDEVELQLLDDDIQFHDKDSVYDDYMNGMSVEDVVDNIIKEYSDW